MNTRKVWSWARKGGGLILSLLLLAYIVYHLIQGDRGMRAWLRLRHDLQQKQQDLQTLISEKNHLEKEIFLLRDETLDPELLGEYLRKILHYAPPHDWMILIPDEPSSFIERPDI